MSKAAPRFHDDSRAVSTAVGAILLVTIIFMALLVVQTSFVPRWEEEAEEQHSRDVQRQFLDIVSHIEQRAHNGTSTPTTLTLSMETGSRTIFSSGPRLPGEVLLSTVPFGSNFEASEMSVAELDGRSLAVMEEFWVGITGTHSVDQLTAVDHLRLRVQTPASQAGGDQATIEIIDADGLSAGKLTVHIETYTNGYGVRLKVENPAGDTITDNGESRLADDAPSYVYLDAMAPDTYFGTLLHAAKKPVSLDMIETGLTVAFSIQGETTTGDPIDGASPGPTYVNVTRQADTGRLRVILPNQEFPSQELVIDHGAVVIRQPDGVAFLEPPAFDVGPLGALTEVVITDTVPGGVPRGVSSHGPVRVTLGTTEVSSLKGTAPDASWNITTTWPQLWSDHWDTHLSASGWDDTAGHYTITTGPDWARLDLQGLDPGASHDLLIRWTQATISTTLET